jgi:nucleoside-diphosphate-sugar epimerase
MVTGENGFLLGHLLDKIPQDILDDSLIHFGFPSCSEDFKDVDKMRKSLKDSIEYFDKAMKENKKIIFASSEAVFFEDTWYSVNKKALEYYIKDYEKSLILRIPRVYGKDRNKGLIKTLKNNTFKGDKNKIMEYIDINDWVNETLKIIGYNGIYEYKNKKKNTIKEIEEIYCK